MPERDVTITSLKIAYRNADSVIIFMFLVLWDFCVTAVTKLKLSSGSDGEIELIASGSDRDLTGNWI